MSLYPVGLRLSGLRVLVVGGGTVALRKATALLEAGAMADVRTRSSDAWSGSHTVKQEPWPTALSTATAPPCSSASSLTMARPSPVPSNFRARPLSI